MRRESDDQWLIKEHSRGNLECGGCDYLYQYPKRCKCGGLVHLTIVQEPDNTKSKYKTCDRCETDYKEV
jgi:hypothetical protein